MNQNEKKYHILFCSVSLAAGGEQKQLAQILQNLNQQRYEPVLCCIKPFQQIDEAIRSLGIPLLSLGIQNHHNLPRVVWGLRRVINQYDIDLMFSGIFGSEYEGRLAAMSMGTPTVAILQSMFDLSARAQVSKTNGFAWHCKWRILYAIHAVLARMPKIHYVALSEAVKQSAIRELHLPAKHVTVVPLGLTPEIFDARLLPRHTMTRLKDELGLDGAYPILLNVARLSAVKGQKDLLEVMPQVLERFPHAKLLIAGDGTSQFIQELSSLRDHLNLQEHVQLLGHRDDIAALLHISDMFVFSSYYEGLPGSVIEAMAAGKPVVAFDIPSIRVLVIDGSTGILVRERNIVLFAESIVQLAEHPATARKMGERAQQIVQREFDIRQNIKELEAIFQRMLIRPSGQDENQT